MRPFFEDYDAWKTDPEWDDQPDERDDDDERYERNRDDGYESDFA